MIRRLGTLLVAVGLSITWLPANAANPSFTLRLAGVSPSWIRATQSVQWQFNSVSTSDRSGVLRLRLSAKPLLGRSQISDVLQGDLSSTMTAALVQQTVQLTAGSNRIAVELPSNVVAGLSDGVYAVQAELVSDGRTQKMQTLLPVMRGVVQQQVWEAERA